MTEQERWLKLEEIIRKVVREEIKVLGKKPKINLANGKFLGVTSEQLESWQAAYPAVDIESEIRRAAAWCLSNPTNAPKSEYGRYLNSWLSREQNRAAIKSIPSQKPGPGLKLCAYCEKVATGAPNNTPACNDHFRNAMDHDPVPRMRGLVAKPVAGS